MKITAALSFAAAIACLSACTMPARTAEEKDRAATDQLQAQANAEVGMPAINNFTEKKLATKLSELRDKPDLATFTYVQGMDGKLRCLGRSIGFGIPYSTQITNPQKIAEQYSSGYAILPQAEPNGLYMPESASATWVMLVDEKGSANPTYVEPNITVSTTSLHGPAVSDPCA